MSTQLSLSERYYYGLTYGGMGLKSPESAGAERISREERVESILNNQLSVQKTTLNELKYAASGISETILSSIEEQTGRLEYAIASSTEAIVEAIDKSTVEICTALSAIQWQIQQTNSLLTETLKTLRENRANEARQLVDQGVRHMIFGEFGEAEERFLRALDFDTTDFQILINLGQVELEKCNYESAKMYFQKATTLPPNLSPEAKAIGFRHLARLDYAVENFDSAATFQALVCQLSVRTPKDVYLNGVYHLLSGKVTDGLALIKESVNLEPDFFPASATDPDLSSNRDSLLKMLSRLGTSEKKRNELAQKNLGHMVGLLSRHDKSLVYKFDEITDLQSQFQEIARCGAFGHLRRSSEGMESLSSATRDTKEETEVSEKLRGISSKFVRYKFFLNNNLPGDEGEGCGFVAVSVYITGVVTGLLVIDGAAKVVLALLWPLLFLNDVLSWFFFLINGRSWEREWFEAIPIPLPLLLVTFSIPGILLKIFLDWKRKKGARIERSLEGTNRYLERERGNAREKTSSALERARKSLQQIKLKKGSEQGAQGRERRREGRPPPPSADQGRERREKARERMRREKGLGEE